MTLYERKTEATRMLKINLQKYAMNSNDMERYVTEHYGLSMRFVKKFIHLNQSYLTTTPDGFKWKEE